MISLFIPLFQAIERELKVWVGLNHRNVLPLYGITGGFGPFPAFVCPWAHNGTLSEYLEKSEARLGLKDRMILVCSCNIADLALFNSIHSSTT